MRYTSYKLWGILLGLGFFLSCNTKESTRSNANALSCYDGVRNGNEIGIDCGGDCPDLCKVYENGLEGVILDRLHLKQNTTYTLTGPLLIRDQSSLEISAGTNIKVLPGVGAYIAIAQGGTLYSYGNDQVPIVIESAAENPAPGDWGGIIVLGQATVNTTKENLSEIGSYLYGGPYPNDFSVFLRNTIIKHTGEKINDVTTHGLTLQGVGSQSYVNKVEISDSNGAGIRIVGGRVNLGQIYLHDVANGIEVTDGWQGTLDQVYMSRVKNEAFILENQVKNPLVTPYTVATIKNSSLLGPFNGAAFHLKNGGGELYLSNLYMGKIARFLNVEGAEALSLFSDRKMVVDTIEFANTLDPFSLISPSNIPLDFISQSTATGAENKDVLPSWLTSWISH